MDRATAPRTGIYVRISDDAMGDGLGVARQEADCRALVERNGGTVVEVYSDNDKSAYQRRKVRPAYQRMLADIADGKLDAVVAWHPDRLHRQLRELVPFIDLVNDHHLQVETVKAGVYDLSTPSGRLQARIAGAVAEHESEHKSDRIKRKLEENAATGKSHGGSRPYGWEEDRITLRDNETKFVKLAAERALSGVSMRAVARELNEAGSRTATGKEWSGVTVRDMLIRPRNAGIRMHQGVEHVQGAWTPILSPEDFRQLQAMLSNPERVTNPGKTGKVHLLSVIAKCGICGASMIVSKGKAYKGKSKPIYRCGVGSHVTRDQFELDKFVTRLTIARLEQMDIRDLMVESRRRTKMARQQAAEMQAIEDRMQDAAEAYAAGSISLTQLTAINAALNPKLETLRSDAVSPSRERVIGDLVGSPEPMAVWESLSPDRRRAVIALLWDIRVMKATPGSIFDPRCITVVPR